MNDRKLGEKVLTTLWENGWRETELKWIITIENTNAVINLGGQQASNIDDNRHIVSRTSDHRILCCIGSLARQRKLNTDQLDTHQLIRLQALYTTIPTPEESKEARQQQFYDQVKLGIDLYQSLTPYTIVFEDESGKPSWRRYRTVNHPKFGTGYFNRTCYPNEKWPYVPFARFYDLSCPEPYRKLGRWLAQKDFRELRYQLDLDSIGELKLAAAYALYKEKGRLNERVLSTTTAS